jgi:uroporphyrinogen-III synthase
MTRTSEEKAYGLISTPANESVAAELKNGGSRVIEFPAVLSPAGLGQGDVLADIEDLDWIVFPDIFSTNYFFEALGGPGRGPADVEFLQTCAVGEATANRLRCFHVHTDLVLQSAAEALPALSDYLAGAGLKGLKFLIPKMKGAGSELGQALIEAGAAVTELPVYQHLETAEENLPKLRALLAGGAVDEFVFCHPGDVDNLLYICETVDIQTLLSGIKVAAANESVAVLLDGLGLRASILRLK